MRRRTIFSRTGILAAVLVLPVTSAAADVSSWEALSSGIELNVPDTSSSGVMEELVYPAITSEQNEWLNILGTQFEQADNFVSSEISLDRKEITVTWFGPLDPELERLVLSPPPTTDIKVKASKYSGAELRAAIANVFANPPASVQIASGGITPDGSGIEVAVVSADRNPLDLVSLGKQLGGDIPVIVTVTNAVKPL